MDYEKNEDLTTAKSTALLLPHRRSKTNSGFFYLVVFISFVLLISTYDLAINILSVKSIYGSLHNRDSADTSDVSPLCFMLGSAYGCVPRHPYERPPGFRRNFQDKDVNLLPHRRFLKKLRGTQKNETQPAQAG